MTEAFTDKIATIADIRMFTVTKAAGAIVVADPLKLDPCSTLDLNKFYAPRKSSESSMAYL